MKRIICLAILTFAFVGCADNTKIKKIVDQGSSCVAYRFFGKVGGGLLSEVPWVDESEENVIVVGNSNRAISIYFLDRITAFQLDRLNIEAEAVGCPTRILVENNTLILKEE